MLFQKQQKKEKKIKEIKEKLKDKKFSVCDCQNIQTQILEHRKKNKKLRILKNNLEYPSKNPF